MKNTVKKIIKTASFILLVVLCFSLLTPVFQKKSTEGAWNYTTKVNGFRNLDENSLDMIVFGSSHAYCSFVPSVLSEHGISSYVLATQQQPSYISYHYMKEALKTQKPKVIVYETFMIRSSEYVPDDSVIYDAANQLPLSVNKLEMLRAATKGKKAGEKLPFYLTLLKYHNRYGDLTDEDFYYDPSADSDEYSGYVYLESAKPVEAITLENPDETWAICDRDLEYLGKMAKLCEENGIKFVLAYAPYVVGDDSIGDLNAIAEYAEKNEISFYNGYKEFDSLTLDLETVFYGTNHLNYSGATKFSHAFAKYIAEYIN